MLLLGIGSTINSKIYIKLAREIFEKTDILNFFLMCTTLDFMGSGRIKWLGVFVKAIQI